MRISIRLANDLHVAALLEARIRGCTLSTLVEDGLRRVLAQSAVGSRSKRDPSPISAQKKGNLPDVDPDSGAAGPHLGD